MKTLLCLACTDEALTVLHTSDQGKCLKEIEFSMQAQIPFLARAVGVPVGRRSGLAMTLVATIFIVLFFLFSPLFFPFFFSFLLRRDLFS